MSAEEDLNQERRITFCMYECWEKLTGEAGLPALKSMNREEIAPFKKNLVLIDLRNGHDNPTFQVIGSELQEDLEEDLSNKHVSSVPRRTMLSRVTDHYLEVMANRVPIAFEAEFVNTDNEKALYRGILLPFSDDGENINFILGGVRWILEKDVTLDDSKPTIEELMRSISNGREDAPVEYDEAAIAAEQDIQDTVPEDYIDVESAQEEPYQSDTSSTDTFDATVAGDFDEEAREDYNDAEEGTLNDGLDEDAALAEDDFIVVGEVDELNETDEDETDEVDLAAENLIEDDDQTVELTPAEGADREKEELIESVDVDTEFSEDDFDNLTDVDLVEPVSEDPIIETDALEDVASEDVVSAEDAVTFENETSEFTDAPGITRKDFVPATDEKTPEEAEDGVELIGDVETDLLADPEQQDESEIFAESDQPDETLFDTAEEENDPATDEGNFAEIFDTEDETTIDGAQSEAESELPPIEENALSFVESLEKELYSHSDEIDVEEELVAKEASEDGGADLETKTILETPEEKDRTEEDTWDTASTNDEPEESLIAESAEELLDESDEAHLFKNTRDLTLNELLSEGVDDDVETTQTNDVTESPSDAQDLMPELLEEGEIGEDAAAWENTEVEDIPEEPDLEVPRDKDVSEADVDEKPDDAAINELGEGALIAEEITENALKGDETSEFLLDDEYLEIEDDGAFEDKIVEDLINEDDFNLPDTLEEIHESDPETAAVERADVPSTEDLSIEELMESIISERNFELSHDIEDSKELEDAVEAIDSSVLEIEDGIVEEDTDEEYPDVEDVAEVNVSESSIDGAEEDTRELAEQVEPAEIHEAEAEEGLTADITDDRDNEAWQNDQDTSDNIEVDVDASEAIEQEPLSTKETSIEFKEVAQTPVTTDAPKEKPKRISVIERAMEMMAPNFSRPKDPVVPDVPHMPSVESMEETVTIDETPEPTDGEDLAMGSVEFTEEPVNADVAPESLDNRDFATDSMETTEEEVDAESASEPDHEDQDDALEIEENDNEVDDLAEDPPLAEPVITPHDSPLDEAPSEAEIDAPDSLATLSTVEEQAKSLQDLRATLKQIIGYIKKEDKNHNRSRDSLYNILTAIYEFHDTCESSPDAYNAIVNEHDLKVQSRAPFTPVLKICLGKDYDKTRLTEYAAALGIARYMNVDISEFHAFIKNFPGGIKGCVKEMRAIRKHGTSGNIAARKTRSIEEAREILREMAPIASFRLKKIIVGNNVDEFCLLLAKRDGHDINVLKILDEKYTKLDPVIKRAAFIKGNLNDRK